MSTHTPKRLIWLVDGEPHAGCLANYVDDVLGGQYFGLEVSPHIWRFSVGDENFVRQSVRSQVIYEDDDWRTIELSVGDEHAIYRLDLRA